MKFVAFVVVVLATAWAIVSCEQKQPSERYVLQKIPIKVQRGKAVGINIRGLSGNGWNDVGIRCSPEMWKTLTSGTNDILVHLKSSNKKGTEIRGVYPKGSPVGPLYLIPDVHYLFIIGGEIRAEASVEIVFPGGKAEAEYAEIIVGETPADTGP